MNEIKLVQTHDNSRIELNDKNFGNGIDVISCDLPEIVMDDIQEEIQLCEFFDCLLCFGGKSTNNNGDGRLL